MFFEENARDKINQFSHAEKSNYSLMTKLLDRQVEIIIQTRDLRAENDFFETLDEVALSLKRDTIFFINVLEKGQKIVQNYVSNHRDCDAFMENFFQSLQNFLPKKVKEVMFDDVLLCRALNAIKSILDRVSPRLKIQQDFAMNHQQIAHYFFALSTDTFKRSAACMLLMTSIDSRYLKFISGNLLNPNDSHEFYRTLLTQKRLAIKCLPQSVQLSGELKTIVFEHYHQEMSHAMMWGAYGLGVSIVGIIMLAQWTAMYTMIGAASLITGLALVSIFSHEYLTSPWHTERQALAI